MPAQFEVGLHTRRELGLATHFVFPLESAGAPWIEEMLGDGMSVSLIDRSAPRSRRARWLRRVAADRRACVVHSHFTSFDTECVWAARATCGHAVWHMHGGMWPYTFARRVIDVGKVRVIGRGCDRVVACAPWIGDQAVERGFAPSKVRVVPEAIVLERFDEHELPDQPTARQRFALDDDRKVVLAFCWDPERKGADLILRAAREVATGSGAAPLFVLVGGDALAAYVDRELGGKRPPWLRLMAAVDDAPALYRAADVFVNASRHEGMPFAVAEAMAAGRPVIASDIPGSALYLPAPGLTRFRSEDAGSLRSALAETLAAADLAERGARNREFAAARFGIEPYTHAIVAIYRELLEAPARPR